MRQRLTTPVLPAFFILTAALLAGCSSTPKADDADDTATHASSEPAFDITVKAPKKVQEYLEQYVELKRYRNFPGLQMSEMTRLLGGADENVRELLGTLGYFSPEIKIDVYDTGAAPADSGISTENSQTRPQLVIEVEPGPQTTVAEVQLDYSGEVTEEKNFASRRARFERNWDLQPGEGFTQKGWDGAKSEGLRSLQRNRYPTAKSATAAPTSMATATRPSCP